MLVNACVLALGVLCQCVSQHKLLPYDVCLMLSRFVDWQKVRVQENSADIPGGAMPRSMDVVLRNELVEQTKAGDRSIFTGTLIVVPDVSQMNMPGVNAKAVRQGDGEGANFRMEGVRGMADLGIARDLTYRLCFLATHVQSAESGVCLHISLMCRCKRVSAWYCVGVSVLLMRTPCTNGH